MGQDEITVSVIIPTYNCKRYVGRAITSVLGQTYKDFEIIIVDDGSTDGTKEVLSEFLGLANVSYIHQENKGVACARNVGIRASHGKYIALLDADDWWEPEKLERQITIFQLNPTIDLIHSNIFIANEADPGRRIKYTQKVDFNNLSPKAALRKVMFWEADVCVPTIIVKKDVLEKIGYFDENLSYIGCEDRDFCIRVFANGPTYFLKEHLANYLVRKKSMSTDSEKMARAREYVIEQIIRVIYKGKGARRIRARLESALAFRIGKNNYHDRHLSAARTKFSKAIACDLLNIKAYLYLCLSFLPINLIKKIIRAGRSRDV